MSDDRKIFIEFTKPAKGFCPFSWLIRKIQGTPYSHVRLRWFSRSGIELIYEASGSQVKLIGEKAQDLHKVKVTCSYEVSVSSEEYRNLIKLFRFASVSYGINQVFGIGAVALLGLKKNPFAKGRGSQVCSELVGLFMDEVKGWEIKYDLDMAGPLEIDLALEEMVKEGVPDLKLLKRG